MIPVKHIIDFRKKQELYKEKSFNDETERKDYNIENMKKYSKRFKKIDSLLISTKQPNISSIVEKREFQEFDLELEKNKTLADREDIGDFKQRFSDDESTLGNDRLINKEESSDDKNVKEEDYIRLEKLLKKELKRKKSSTNSHLIVDNDFESMMSNFSSESTNEIKQNLGGGEIKKNKYKKQTKRNLNKKICSMVTKEQIQKILLRYKNGINTKELFKQVHYIYGIKKENLPKVLKPLLKKVAKQKRERKNVWFLKKNIS